MELTLKKGHLKSWKDFLESLHLKGKKSLGRSKLNEKLDKRLKEYFQDIEEIKKEYGADEQPEDGSFKWKKGKVSEAQEAIAELDDTEVTISLFEYSKWVTPFKEAILNLDEELSGKKADAWMQMVEQFEDEGKDEK